MASKVQTTGSVINFPDLRAGEPYAKDGQTFLQDAGRAADLESGTIVAQDPVTEKWVPLTTILDVAQTSAKAVCGANGGNLAAWQAVGDGEFAVTIDGTLRNITGIVTTAVVALTDLPGIIGAAMAGIATVHYDALGDVFTFTSLTTGIASTITVLAAVAAGAGTDISGAGFLNGTAATLTQGTGYDGTEIPSGVIIETIEAADLVAGDVTDIKVIIGGSGVVFRDDFLVLENSLTMASVVESQNKTIERLLREISIYPQATQAIEWLQT